nr:hypothetical protein [Tanacetum cinerariifolium]
MAAPTISISVDSFKESFRDTIDIGVDVTHPGIHEHLLEVPIHEELRALRDGLDISEAERATLCATIRTIVAVETSLHKNMRDERHTRIEIERQLASVQESHHQDQEDFKKLKDFMTSQCGYRS